MQCCIEGPLTHLLKKCAPCEEGEPSDGPHSSTGGRQLEGGRHHRQHHHPNPLHGTTRLAAVPSPPSSPWSSGAYHPADAGGCSTAASRALVRDACEPGSLSCTQAASCPVLSSLPRPCLAGRQLPGAARSLGVPAPAHT